MSKPTSASTMNAREQSQRDPRQGLSGVAGKAPKLVIAIGPAPTMKKAQVNNSKALKIKK